MPTEQTNRNRTIVIGLALVALLFGGAWWYLHTNSGYPHQFVGGESVQSWDFRGAYTGQPDSEQKGQDEIARLKDLLGKEDDEHTDYSIFVGIAGQYDLLGDGKNEYEYLKKALAIDAEGTGLAWHNMGNLLAHVDALQSARDAFARAAKAQSQQIQYQSVYLEFTTENFPDDTVAIETAFSDAKAIFGDNSTLLEIRARWLESVKRPKEAIEEWKKVKILSPAAGAAIDIEIKRLEGQL